MSNWTKLFPPTILKRGLEYYNAGRVRNLVKSGEHFSATVCGSDYYDVDITIKNREVEKVFCNCPYAEDNDYCKHVAATLYSIEDKYGDEVFNNEKVEEAKFKEVKSNNKYEKLPFQDDGKTHYLNLGPSLDVYKPSAQTYKKALELIDNINPAAAKITVVNEIGSRYLRYEIRISIDDKDIQFVTINLGHNGIENILCAVGSWYNKKYAQLCKSNKQLKNGTIELCIHKTLALMLLIKYIENNRDVIDYSDNIAINLISNFRKEKKSTIAPIEKSESREVDIALYVETYSSYNPTSI